MSKERCYNFNHVTRMLGINGPNHIEHIQEFLQLLDEHEVEIFQPPKSPGSGRARKHVMTYLRATPWLDKYIKQQNLIAVLMDRRICKPTYRELPRVRYTSGSLFDIQ